MKVTAPLSLYHRHILEHEDGGMMGVIQVLPSGSASTTTALDSASSAAPNGNITLTAHVVDAVTGSPAATGSVQFQLKCSDHDSVAVD
jgi:hypothetical protein